MGTRLKKFAAAVGNAAETYLDHQKEVNDMTDELMRRNRNLDVATARSVASTLVVYADVTWK